MAILSSHCQSIARDACAKFSALADALSRPNMALDISRLTDGFWPFPPVVNTQEEYRQWVLVIAKKTVELLETDK